MQGIAERLKSRMILAASGQAPDTRPALIFAEVRAQMHWIWESCQALPNVAILLAEVCLRPTIVMLDSLEAGGGWEEIAGVISHGSIRHAEATMECYAAFSTMAWGEFCSLSMQAERLCKVVVPH